MNKWLVLSTCLIGLLMISSSSAQLINNELVINEFIKSKGGLQEYRNELFNELITKEGYQGILPVWRVN